MQNITRALRIGTRIANQTQFERHDAMTTLFDGFQLEFVHIPDYGFRQIGKQIRCVWICVYYIFIHAPLPPLWTDLLQ
jgi:hypothetical protein